MSVIVYSFAVKAPEESAAREPIWDVYSRQLPRLAVTLLNGDGDEGFRFLPLMGFDGTQRRFFTLDDLPSAQLALGMHRQTPPPALLVDGCFVDEGLRLRILDPADEAPRFDEIVPFSPDDPAPAVARILYELAGVLDLPGGLPKVPCLPAQAWIDYCAAADDLLAVEANLLRHAVRLDAALRAIQLAAGEPLVRRLFLQLAVRAAGIMPADQLTADLLAASGAVRAQVGGADRVEFVSAVATLLERHGQADASAQLRAALAAELPDHLVAVRDAAITLYEKGRVDEALPLLERLIELGHRTPQVLAMLAAVSLQLGDRSRHRRVVDELLGLPVLPAAPSRAVAVWLLEQGRSDDALGVVDAALRTEPDHAGLWLVRAQILLARADGTGAQAALQRCLATGPSEVQRAEVSRLSRLATMPQLLVAMREVDAALADRDPGRVLPLVKELVRKQPELPEAWLFLGTLRQRHGHMRRAARALRRALRLDSRLGEAHDRLAVVLARRGRYAPAHEHLLEAARFLPEAAGPRLHLAQVCCYLGRSDEGRRALEEAARLGADPEQVAAVERSFFAAS